MRKVHGALRMAGQSRGRANPRSAAGVRTAAGAGIVMVLAILFWLIFYQNLPPNLGLNGTPSEGADSLGHSINRIIKACMIATSIYVIAMRWSLAKSLARYVNVGAAAFLLVVALSAVWSIDRGATINGFISLCATVLLCFAISLAGWHPRRFQRLAIPPLMFILVTSLVVGMIFPDRIIEIGLDISQKNSWHGITLTKNQFGMTASIGFIICFQRWLAREGRIYWSILGSGVAFTCLILSRSNTSLFATMLSVLFMVLVMRFPTIKRRYTTQVVVAIAGTMFLYELVIQNVLPGAHTLLSPITALTGKDTTLSARTFIWNLIKEHIASAPYLGTGYGAYWVGPLADSPSHVFVTVMSFYPTEAHNGYLDVVNDLGYVGLICVLVFLFVYMWQALQLVRADRNQAALYLALVFQELVMNMSESDWFARNSSFAVFTLAVFCLSRELLEVRMNAQPAVVARK
jgi:exopolysaccharide production protein ExoQ